MPTDPLWLQRVTVAGNWTNHAHLFADQHTKRARCGVMRMDDEDWQPAPEPIVFVVCRRCELLDRGQDGGV